MIVHRFGRWAYSVKVPVFRQLMIFIYLVVNTVCLAITGIHVHRESDIGPDLVIRNCNANFLLATRISHSCSVNQGVSVASVRARGWPTLGNNVCFGADCKLLGGVTVGDNVVASANSLMVSDLPSNGTVMDVLAASTRAKPLSHYLEFPVVTT